MPCRAYTPLLSPLKFWLSHLCPLCHHHLIPSNVTWNLQRLGRSRGNMFGCPSMNLLLEWAISRYQTHACRNQVQGQVASTRTSSWMWVHVSRETIRVPLVERAWQQSKGRMSDRWGQSCTKGGSGGSEYYPSHHDKTMGHATCQTSHHIHLQSNGSIT